MLSRERVCRVIRHEQPDRMPLYGWVSMNLGEPIAARFGSVEAFEDHYEFDYAHLFGGPPTFRHEDVQALRNAMGDIDPPAALDLPIADPDRREDYQDLIDQVRHHQSERNRFVYVQTPGIFEALNGIFGIEHHLMYLMMYPDELHTIYRRQADWNRRFAMNCLDIGIDMIHVSDDWGGQHALMFSTDTWRDMIYPYHKITADAVKSRGAFLGLHSDGNVDAVLDGIVELGYDVVHPWQESAGMRHDVYLNGYRDRFVLMGGLDVQTTIGFGRHDFLVSEIERVMTTFARGGLLFCTSHFVQNHCSIDELTLAYDTAYRLARTVCAG